MPVTNEEIISWVRTYTKELFSYTLELCEFKLQTYLVRIMPTIPVTKLFVMKSKIAQTILSGLVATAVMTVVGLMAPYMSLPKMNPAEMLSAMMGIPLMIGYLLHFMIGIIFAAAYVYWFNPKVHIESKLLRGGLFGSAVFVFAQVMMFIIGKFMPMPMMQESMMLTILGSLIGHIIFGIMVAVIVPNYYIEGNQDRRRAAHV
jgi:hypothetical protein